MSYSLELMLTICIYQDLINQPLDPFAAMLSWLVYLRLTKTVEIFTLSFFLSTLKYNGLTFCAAPPSTQSFIWKGKHYFLISFLFTVYFIEIVSLPMHWKHSSSPQKYAYKSTLNVWWTTFSTFSHILKMAQKL